VIDFIVAFFRILFGVEKEEPSRNLLQAKKHIRRREQYGIVFLVYFQNCKRSDKKVDFFSGITHALH